ncbi:MAG: VanZ family protein, partial [bacterium]
MRLRFAFVCAWAALIFIGSSFPNPPGATGGEWQYDLAHMVEYAVLAGLALVALRAWRAASGLLGPMAMAWAFAVFYGMSDEFHQSFVPNRDANWLDVGFD